MPPPELLARDTRSLADVVLASVGAGANGAGRLAGAAGDAAGGQDVDTDMDDGDDATDIEAD